MVSKTSCVKECCCPLAKAFMVARKLRLSLDPAVSSKVMSAFPTCRIKETAGSVCVNQHKSQIYGTFRGQQGSTYFWARTFFRSEAATLQLSLICLLQFPGIINRRLEARVGIGCVACRISMKRTGASLKLSKLWNRTAFFEPPLRKWLLKASKICFWGFFADPFPDLDGWFCGDAWFFSEIYLILDLQYFQLKILLPWTVYLSMMVPCALVQVLTIAYPFAGSIAIGQL